MKRYLFLALALLIGCRNNNPPNLEEFGFMPNDLVDIRQTPEYVPLSEYKVPEEDRNVMFSQAGRESEEWGDVIHIRYDRPEKGYIVTVDLYSGDYAEMHFEKGASSFTAEIDMFEEQLLCKEGIGEYNGKETVLPYVPLVFGKKIIPEGTFGFFDVDFDGKDELVYAAYTQGYHGRTAYRVFELDGTEREDAPFDGSIDEMTESNRNEKSIIVFHDGYWESGDVLKYRRRSDGTFHVTDSTHILYKQCEDTAADSVRFHYRKQGDKMVLVKKEVVKGQY